MACDYDFVIVDYSMMILISLRLDRCQLSIVELMRTPLLVTEAAFVVRLGRFAFHEVRLGFDSIALTPLL